MDKICGIYKITSPSNRIYIGQSVNIRKRTMLYKRGNCKNQTKLYRSILKYGWDNHKFEIITTCEVEQLNELEIYYSELYNSTNEKTGLNTRHCGGSRSKLSEETKQKIAKYNTGRKLSIQSREKIRKKLLGNIPWNKGIKSGLVPWNKGVAMSDGAKKHLSEMWTGRIGRESFASKTIIQKTIDGVFVKEWANAREVERELGFSFSCINRCCRGERKHSYNYKWEYLK